MIQHIMELEDGTLVRAGVGEPAIMRVNLTQTVQSGSQLQPGSVCAALAKVAVYGKSPLQQGEAFTLWEEENGERRALGRFFAEQPQHTGPNTVTITAYDTVTLLDKDISGYLESLSGWPYTLEELAAMVSAQCGVTLGEETLLNGDYPVQKFAAHGVTGRRLFQWIAQAAGSFCFADGEGVLRFGWYTPTDLVYTPMDYYGGSLEIADYTTAPVQRVRISRIEEDVGTVYPPDAGEANTFAIVGNPLLTADTADALTEVAGNIYNRLQSMTYTPGTVSLPAGTAPKPGQLFSVTDKKGHTVTLCVMQLRREGGRDTVSCTGAATMDSTTVVNDQSFSALTGKLLRLRTDVEGVLAENRDTQGRLASVELNLEGITSTVQAVREEQKTALTTLEQTAESLSVSVQTILQEGVQKIQNSFGLTVDGSAVTIHREGSQMENRLDEKGMYILRNDSPILTADADGVLAADVTVRNYLVVGDHARFEDYGSGRTACFYVQEGL